MKKILLLLLALITTLGAVLVINWPWSPNSGQSAVTKQEVITPTTEPADEPATASLNNAKFHDNSLSLTATSSQNALDLLKENATVETEEYPGLGTMVKSVEGLAADNQHYWGIYVNGEYAKQGITDTQLEAGDTLELKYETIDATML